MTTPGVACKFSRLDAGQRNELWSLLAMLCSPDIGPRRGHRLIEIFGSAHEAVMAGLRHPEEWQRLKLVPKDSIAHFHSEKWRADAKQIWDNLTAIDPSILLCTDPVYPSLLADIIDPPLLLFAMGDTSLVNNPAVGIVGARDCTPEGRELTSLIAHDLSNSGITVVSGMAKGIDSHAHVGALKGPASTIAVLGSGIDVPYPRENTELMAEISEKGLVLTEYPPGVQPARPNFPRRNRIISALSLGILVVEAAQKSGSLITVRHALEQGKDVFAVPGQARSIFSKGCHELIRQGARPVFDAEDIITELAPQLALWLAANPRPEAPKDAPQPDHQAPTPPGDIKKPVPPAASRKRTRQKTAPALTNNELRIYQRLERSSMTLDALADQLDLEISELMSTLTLLEVKGIVISAETGEYLLKGIST